MMNKIIQSYIDEFKDEEGLSEKDSSILFEHFINHLIVKKDFSDDFDYEAIHTGGGGDCGIDGIAIIADQEVFTLNEQCEILREKRIIRADFVFIQSKTSDSLDTGEILKFINGVENFFNNESKETRKFNEKINNFIKIIEFIYKEPKKLTVLPSLHLKYVYTGKKQTMNDILRVISRSKENFERKGIFLKINIDILDSSDIMDMYRELKLNIEKEIELQKIATLPNIENIQESYTGIIPLEEFIKLISNENGEIIKNLFYENVRDYQGDTKVNKRIADSLKEEGKYFGLYHNGITIISKFLTKTGDRIHLRNFQIVNGCQTSHIIMQNKEYIKDIRNIFIPIKLIASQDDNILNSIIIAANTHNEVKEESFESLEKFHKELEDFYKAKQPKFYYERRSKQYINNEQPRSHIVTLAEQVKSYLSMFHGSPQSTHRYYGELIKVHKSSSGMFQGDNFELYHIAGVTLKKINLFLNEGKIFSQYKHYRYHILFLSRLLLSEKLSTKLSKKDYLKECENIYTILKDDDRLLSIFIECCRIIKQVKNHFDNKANIIRSKDFTEKLKNFVLQSYKNNTSHKKH